VQTFIEVNNTQEQLSDHESLELLRTLHTILDLKILVEKFSHVLHQKFNCAGIRYQHDKLNVLLTEGTLGKYPQHYILNYSNIDLGKLTITAGKPFTKKSLLALENLTCLFASPLQNAVEHYKALQAALHCPLTGISNRAALTITLQRDLELAKRYGTALSIISIDIDHFKKINDIYGHATGDAVLQQFTQKLTKEIRNADMIFRMSGDEFIVLLMHTDTQGAINLANRLCKKVTHFNTQHDNHNIPLTTSIGVAGYISGDTYLSLLKKADQALYRAKNEGRNRVGI